MNDQLDLEIQRAVAEIVGSAPLARPAAVLVPSARTSAAGVSRRRSITAVAVLAAVALIAVAVAVDHRLDRQSVRSVPVVGSSDLDYAPVELPAGVVVWEVSPAVFGPRAGFAAMTQLFGREDSAGKVADQRVLVTVTQDTRSFPAGTPSVRIQDSTAYVTNAETPSVSWPRGGFVAEVRSIGLTLPELVSVMSKLRWREDRADGFDPSAADADFGLLSQEHSTERSSTIYELTGPAGPLIGAYGPRDLGRVFVGGFDGAIRPELLFAGRRSSDGMVISPTSASPTGSSVKMITPDGTTIEIIGSATLPVDAIRATLRLVDSATIAALAGTASQRMSALPEVQRVRIGSAKVVARGNTLDNPLALCLSIGPTETCRHVVDGPGGPITGVTIDGTWYTYGKLAVSSHYLLYRWSADLAPFAPVESTRILQRDDAVDTNATWFVAAIPQGIDAVLAGVEHDGMMAAYSTSSALRRPSW